MTNTNNISSITRTNIISIFLLILIALSATVLLFKSSYNASDLSIVPDSVEYALGAHNIVTNGEYSIAINGQELPPRYPPWFSLLILAPAYLIFGTSIGNAIYAITFFAVIGIVATFLLGKRIAGNMGGLLASQALLLHPLYRNYAGTIMTDVPCVTLILLGCLLYLKIKDNSEPSSLLYISAGLLAALCGAMRPACGSVILPFLFLAVLPLTRKKKMMHLTALLCPTFILITTTAYYNLSTFGNPSRTGYHFWCPIPYDFPHLILSLKHIPSNIKALANDGSLLCIIASIAIITIFYFRRSCSNKTKRLIRNASLFGILAVGPIMIFHLVYFFPSSRLFMPIISLLLVLAVAITAKALRISKESIIPILIQTVILTSFIAFRLIIIQTPPSRILAANRIKKNTPPNALIITAIDPVYMEFMTNRKILPISRRIEYASKIIAEHKLTPTFKPENWLDFSRSALLAAGGKSPIPFVATDLPPILIDDINSGAPVYLDTSHITGHDHAIVSTITQHSTLTEKAEDLYKVTPQLRTSN